MASQPATTGDGVGASRRRVWRIWIRRAALAVSGVCVVCLAWLTVNRVQCSRHALRVSADPSLATAVVTSPSKDDLLRIACFNIAHGRGSGPSNWNGEDAKTRENRLSEIAGFLRAAELDIVVLNEVDFDSTWSQGLNQAEFLAREAGFKWRLEQRNFDFALPGLRFAFGNAVLSRYPITEARLVELPADAAWESAVAGQKSGCVCTIEWIDGRVIRVFPVHLSYRSEAVRIASCAAIIEELTRHPTPMIVAGDFNSTPKKFPAADPSGASALDDMLAAGKWTTLPIESPGEPDFTFSSTQPDQVIDWILVPKPWSLVSKQVFPITLSDHRPVVGLIRWQDPGLRSDGEFE